MPSVGTNKPDRRALRVTSPQAAKATSSRAMPSAEPVTSENDKGLCSLTLPNHCAVCAALTSSLNSVIGGYPSPWQGAAQVRGLR